ncbi:hypothetical protein Tco_0431497 [Tanacetum coccineum]
MRNRYCQKDAWCNKGHDDGEGVCVAGVQKGTMARCESRYRVGHIANKYRFYNAWIAKGREHTCLFGKVCGIWPQYPNSSGSRDVSLSEMHEHVRIEVVGPAEIVGLTETDRPARDVGPAKKDREWRLGGLGVMAHKGCKDREMHEVTDIHKRIKIKSKPSTGTKRA